MYEFASELKPGQALRSMGQTVYVVSVERRSTDNVRPYVITTEPYPDSAPENYSVIYATPENLFPLEDTDEIDAAEQHEEDMLNEQTRREIEYDMRRL